MVPSGAPAAVGGGGVPRATLEGFLGVAVLGFRLGGGVLILYPRQLEETEGSSVLFLLLESGESLGLTWMLQPFIWAFVVFRSRYVSITLLYLFCVSDS